MTKNNETKPKLMVIDGNALIHRSFHALPTTLTTRSGEIVNAVYGFAAFLLKAIKEFKPAYIALTLDRPKPTFRHQAYDKYKATRVKAPQELYDQIGRVKEVAEILSIPIFELDGFEADDLIGTIARKTDDSVDTIIVTGDQDTLQLVDDSTFVYTMSRGLNDPALYDIKGVSARYGFGPLQLIDYKALRGDPSDNIPGVPGIGEKTAKELIAEFGSLEKIYQSLGKAELKDRTRQLLLTGRESGELSKRLATIDTAAPIEFDLQRARFGGFDLAKAQALFTELEFKSLINRLNETASLYGQKATGLEEKLERNIAKFRYRLVKTDKDFDKFMTALAKTREFAFDTETTGLDNFTAKLRGMSFSWKEGDSWFVSFDNGAEELNLFSLSEGPSLDLDKRLERLKPILENPEIKKIGHNLKFDLKIVRALGIEMAGIDFDTMIASYLLYPDNRQRSLDALSLSELKLDKISKEELTKTKSGDKNFAAVPVEQLANYACEDADAAWRLGRAFLPKLKSEKLFKLFKAVEMPLLPVLARMEIAGVLLDTAHLKAMDKRMDARLLELQKNIWREAGNKFNVGSVQQLRKVLFEDLGLSAAGVGRTKTGLSTGAAELDKLKGLHPIIDLILEWREVNKLSNTYVKALPELINKATGRLHTSFNQTVAATGRLSSSNPNLQNIPARTELGRDIRRAFVAAPGRRLLSLDYSQIELRVAAHLTDDPGLLKAFKEGRDIHQATAAAVNHIDFDQVTKAERQAAKAVNFGLLYGQGPRGLSEQIGVSFAEAKDFIDAYFAEFARVKHYFETIIKQAQTKGYVETILGRRRYLPEINSTVAVIRKAAERTAINTPLQGSAADMTKLAMIEIDKLLENEYRDKVKMILQVHDELVFETDEDAVAEITPKLKAIMENVVKLKVPVVVDAKVGDNWEDMTGADK